MSTIYLTTQGSTLRKEEHRFTVVKDGKTVLSVPDFKVDRILVYGSVQITTQALRFALKNDIPITFLTMYGRLIGAALPSFSKNIFLRINQFKSLSLDSERVLLAKKILSAKVSNSLTMLKRFARSKDFQIINENKFHSARFDIEDANSIGTLRGVEGGVSSVYFMNLRELLSPEVSFKGRNYHPAKDPFNSLLNFLYSLLSNEMLGVIHSKGLDPYLGFLHSVEYGRFSLVFDLVEPFRACIADAVAVKLFRKGIIDETDFKKHKLYGFVLKDDVRKIVLKHYEEKMDTGFIYEGARVNFRQVFVKMVDSFSDYISEGKDFRPFVLKK